MQTAKSSYHDVVVIGSGIAGSIVAGELVRKSNCDVLILEASGTIRKTPRSLEFYKGVVSDLSEPHSQPHEHRDLAIGGTSQSWGGGLVMFDHSDFETRNTEGHKYWPISLHMMKPWYSFAAERFGVPSNALNQNRSSQFNEFFSPESGFCASSVVLRRWRNHNFLKDIKKIKLAPNSVVIDLIPLDDGSTQVKILDYQNGGFRNVVGNKIILATGGLESTRFFMNSKYLMSASKNSTSVGSYYSTHISGSLGVLFENKSHSLKKFSRVNVDEFSRYISYIYTTSEKGFHSIKLTLQPVSSDNYRLISRLFKNNATSFAALSRYASAWHVNFDSDQNPNIDSRLKLSDKIGLDGRPQIEIEHKISDVDWFNIEKVSTQLQRRAPERGLEFVPNSVFDLKRSIRGQSHHLGSLRMSEIQRNGVVDSNLQVFGTPNIYVLSGAVFPTYSYANPTLTLGALACRLASQIIQS